MKIKPVLGGLALAGLLAWGALVFLRQPMAPALDLVDLRGEAITSASLKGKVVLVNFWATSCVTCVHEMPQLVETFQKYRDQGLLQGQKESL